MTSRSPHIFKDMVSSDDTIVRTKNNIHTVYFNKRMCLSCVAVSLIARYALIYLTTPTLCGHATSILQQLEQEGMLQFGMLSIRQAPN